MITLRHLALTILGIIGTGVILLMGFMAYQEGDNLEAAGWLASGLLTLQTIAARVVEVSLGQRGNPPEEK